MFCHLLPLISSAAGIKRNTMLDYYHIGAYGQVHQQRWSCCNAANRDTQGCQRTTTAQSMNGNKQHHRTTSLRIESRSPSKSRRQNASLYGPMSRKPREQGELQDRSPSPIFHDAIEPPEVPSQCSQSLATDSSILTECERERHGATSLLMHQDSQTDSGIV